MSGSDVVESSEPVIKKINVKKEPSNAVSALEGKKVANNPPNQPNEDLARIRTGLSNAVLERDTEVLQATATDEGVLRTEIGPQTKDRSQVILIENPIALAIERLYSRIKLWVSTQLNKLFPF